MSELRKDPVIDRWVIIAKDRGKRPFGYKISTASLSEALCPFCPGNEDQTPPEIERICTNSSDWLARVIPNKYPAVFPEVASCHGEAPFFHCMNGFGKHEVIIETSDHNESMYQYNEHHMNQVLYLYRDRINKIKMIDNLKYVIVFKNDGFRAGATLSHAHTQLIALPVIPQNISEELRGADRYYSETGQCVYCAMILHERQKKERIVYENDEFLVLSPYASRFPYETWIIPKRHAAHFEDSTDQTLNTLGGVLSGVLRGLHRQIDDLNYNFVIHSSPVYAAAETYYHWHLEIIPRTTNIAGFEWGTGYYINALPPEQAAENLRKIMYH